MDAAIPRPLSLAPGLCLAGRASRGSSVLRLGLALASPPAEPRILGRGRPGLRCTPEPPLTDPRGPVPPAPPRHQLEAVLGDVLKGVPTALPDGATPGPHAEGPSRAPPRRRWCWMLFVQHHSPAAGPGQRLLLGAEGAWATRPLPPAVPCVWVGGRGLHPGRGKGGPRCPPPPTLPGYAHLCLPSPRPAGAEAADAGEAEHRQLSPGHHSAHQAAGPQVPAGLQRAERNRESTPPLAAQAAGSQPGRCPGAGQARTGSPTPCPAPSPLRAALEGLWGSPGRWSTDAHSPGQRQTLCLADRRPLGHSVPGTEGSGGLPGGGVRLPQICASSPGQHSSL